jgi:hypothetical protein
MSIHGDIVRENTKVNRSVPFYSTVFPPHSHSIVPGGLLVIS